MEREGKDRERKDECREKKNIYIKWVKEEKIRKIRKRKGEEKQRREGKFRRGKKWGGYDK